MIKTIHFIQRLGQRGFKFDIVKIALELGFIDGDKYILDRKTALKFLSDLDKLRAALIKIVDKKGLTVVKEEDRLITVYNHIDRKFR